MEIKEKLQRELAIYANLACDRLFKLLSIEVTQNTSIDKDVCSKIKDEPKDEYAIQLKKACKIFHSLKLENTEDRIILKDILTLLENIRNYFSHVDHDKVEIVNPKTKNSLNIIFKNTQKIQEKDFHFDLDQKNIGFYVHIICAFLTKEENHDFLWCLLKAYYQTKNTCFSVINAKATEFQKEEHYALFSQYSLRSHHVLVSQDVKDKIQLFDYLDYLKKNPSHNWSNHPIDKKEKREKDKFFEYTIDYLLTATKMPENWSFAFHFFDDELEKVKKEWAENRPEDEALPLYAKLNWQNNTAYQGYYKADENFQTEREEDNLALFYPVQKNMVLLQIEQEGKKYVFSLSKIMVRHIVMKVPIQTEKQKEYFSSLENNLIQYFNAFVQENRQEKIGISLLSVDHRIKKIKEIYKELNIDEPIRVVKAIIRTFNQMIMVDDSKSYGISKALYFEYYHKLYHFATEKDNLITFIKKEGKDILLRTLALEEAENLQDVLNKVKKYWNDYLEYFEKSKWRKYFEGKKTELLRRGFVKNLEEKMSKLQLNEEELAHYQKDLQKLGLLGRRPNQKKYSTTPSRYLEKYENENLLRARGTCKTALGVHYHALQEGLTCKNVKEKTERTKDNSYEKLLKLGLQNYYEMQGLAKKEKDLCLDVLKQDEVIAHIAYLKAQKIYKKDLVEDLEKLVENSHSEITIPFGKEKKVIFQTSTYKRNRGQEKAAFITNLLEAPYFQGLSEIYFEQKGKEKKTVKKGLQKYMEDNLAFLDKLFAWEKSQIYDTQGQRIKERKAGENRIDFNELTEDKELPKYRNMALHLGCGFLNLKDVSEKESFFKFGMEKL